MKFFIYFTIIVALVELSKAQLKKNDFTVKFLDSSNENGYNVYASDETSFRDEKWRFNLNDPLFFIRKLGYRKPNSNQFDVIETQIDSTGTHVKKYIIDNEEKKQQDPINEPEIMERIAPKINENNFKYYEPVFAHTDIKPQMVEVSPIQAKPSFVTNIISIVNDKPLVTDNLDKTEEHNPIDLKPMAVKPVSNKAPNIKPLKPKPVKDALVEDTQDAIPVAVKPVATKTPTIKPVKPKPVKDIIVDGNQDTIKPIATKLPKDKPLAIKPVSTRSPTVKPVKPKPVKDIVDVNKPIATKPVKVKPVKDTIVDPVVAIKPPTKKPVKVKPVKPAKPAKPAKPTKPIVAVNDIKAPDQGPFPGLSFLWSLYRRPVVTVVGAFLNRPETGLNWIPFIANAPTLPPWPPKLPWERFPLVG